MKMQAETVLITGANRGIGLALSEALLRSEGPMYLEDGASNRMGATKQRMAAGEEEIWLRAGTMTCRDVHR